MATLEQRKWRIPLWGRGGACTCCFSDCKAGGDEKQESPESFVPTPIQKPNVWLVFVPFIRSQAPTTLDDTGSLFLIWLSPFLLRNFRRYTYLLPEV